MVQVLHSKEEFDNANRSNTRCIVYDFSDDHCYYKDVRAAFDKYVAEKGVVAYRIDPMVARIYPAQCNVGAFQPYHHGQPLQEMRVNKMGDFNKLKEMIDFAATSS